MYKNTNVLKQHFYQSAIPNIIWDNDVLVFSHLRWNSVFQRPQQILTRLSPNRRVFFFEEPLYDPKTSSEYCMTQYDNISVITPFLKSEEISKSEILNIHRSIINEIIDTFRIKEYISWYYTPMALDYTDELRPELTVYDCIDDFSAYKNVPNYLNDLEKNLLSKAEILFTGRRSLLDSKSEFHNNAHCFPSSIEFEHYNRKNLTEPYEQLLIPNPKIGFSGIIDERFNGELLNDISELRPEWNFIIMGPVANINDKLLPKKDNIFYFGQKSYNDLPSYILHWNAAIIPYFKNNSTKYTSPDKVLEYLAAGKPVVSTSIHDVVFPFGKEQVIRIADTADEFVRELENGFNDIHDSDWQKKRKKLFANTSWDATWEKMDNVISSQILQKRLISLNSRIKEGLII